ncbi:MAG: PLP-dependent aminotransferase family protein [Frankiaceae bacterium]
MEPAPQHRRTLWLPLDLNDQPGSTLRQKLREALKEAVRAGRLAPGTPVPSSRTLAEDLGVSRGVVVDAYAQLVAEGFLSSRAGSGTVVSDVARPLPRPAPVAVPAVPLGGPRYDIDLRPGPPDLAAFPRTAWVAATRDVLRSIPDEELGYIAPWGASALRSELADYLQRVRAAMVKAEQLIIVSGATQAMSLLVRTLAEIGHTSLAVESPSNAVQRRVLGRYLPAIVDIPVDHEGLDVRVLERTSCRAVLVTPAHQYPSGVVLSPARRNALLRWAERVDGIVIEDDYDSEFRYDRRPIGCLQGLGPDHVALVGSVSKSLAPGMRLGWAVAPPPLHDMLVSAKRDDDFGSPVLGQHVLARMLAGGGYDRHIRRARRRYSDRREVLLAGLARELPDWSESGNAGGLHVMLWLPAGLDEERLCAAAATRGLAIQGTRSMFGALPAPDGLILSYARAPAGLLTEAVRRLAEAAKTAAGTSIRAGSVAAAVRDVRPATALDYF